MGRRFMAYQLDLALNNGRFIDIAAAFDDFPSTPFLSVCCPDRLAVDGDGNAMHPFDMLDFLGAFMPICIKGI
jgi:hypothetical protein